MKNITHRQFVQTIATSVVVDASHSRLVPCQSPRSARSGFPDEFKWDSAPSAYQLEGAVGKDGRGPSIWNTLSRTPGKMHQGDMGASRMTHAK
jgi:hypothetical protein